MRPKAFEYAELGSFLRAYMDFRRRRPASFSLRQWSTKLGLKSPATLSMLYSGKRAPSEELISRLGDYFKMSTDERAYFENLARLSRVQKNSSRELEIKKQLDKVRPKKSKPLYMLDIKHFSTVANWYCYAIREMIHWKKFKADPRWIAKQLLFPISIEKIKTALVDLQDLGLIYQDKQGAWKQRHVQITTSEDKQSEAIQFYHASMCDLAKKSIQQVEVQNRDFSGSTFNIKIDDLSKLKIELRKIRKEIYQKYESLEDGEATYQLNFQLFPLTHHGGKK